MPIDAETYRHWGHIPSADKIARTIRQELKAGSKSKPVAASSRKEAAKPKAVAKAKVMAPARKAARPRPKAGSAR